MILPDQTAQTVKVLRARADELERHVAELRRTADFLASEFGLVEAGIDPEPPNAPEMKTEPREKPISVLVRCSGSEANPDCPNMLERKRPRKVNRCEDCHRCEAAARGRRMRAAKKNRKARFKEVWHGGEGLSSGAPSSLGKDNLAEAGV